MPNEALLQLLDTLGKAGGMQALAPMFDEMKLDGSRAASVLSVLAGNIESVRREQKLAQEAFDEGTSAITEFNVQNNTVQAQLDKAKKSFNELSVELGKICFLSCAMRLPVRRPCSWYLRRLSPL